MKKVKISNPRILMFVPKYPYPIVGGLERQSHLLSQELIKLGTQVNVVSSKFDYTQKSKETIEGVLVYRFPYFSSRCFRFIFTPFFIFSVFFKLRKTYDILHIHQHSWIGLFVILIGKLFKKQVITKLPNVGIDGIPGLKKSFLERAKMNILMKSNSIVAMTFQSLAELNTIGYPINRVLCTPNGIKITEKSFKKKYDETCNVGISGRLVKQKGLNQLLEAWNLVCTDKSHKAILNIFGDGPLLNELQKKCEHLNIDKRVKFYGFINDMQSELASIDIFVNSSIIEGNSNSILEAMMNSIPVVCTDAGGNALQVGPEGSKNVSPINDVRSLSENILKLIKDPHQRLDYGAKMRERVEKHFTIETVAQTYLSGYKCLYQKHHNLMWKESNKIYTSELLTYIECEC